MDPEMEKDLPNRIVARDGLEWILAPSHSHSKEETNLSNEMAIPIPVLGVEGRALDPARQRDRKG